MLIGFGKEMYYLQELCFKELPCKCCLINYILIKMRKVFSLNFIRLNIDRYNPPINFRALSLNETRHVVENRTAVIDIRRY